VFSGVLPNSPSIDIRRALAIAMTRVFPCAVLVSLLAAVVQSHPGIEIAPGVFLPLVNLGTGSGQKGNVTNATLLWLKAGGIGIDTALDYEDETGIAKGLAAAGQWRYHLTSNSAVSEPVDSHGVPARCSDSARAVSRSSQQKGISHNENPMHRLR